MPDSKNVAVAVVGMCGSGKSVLANHFINDGWACVYFGGVTMKILERKGSRKPNITKNKFEKTCVKSMAWKPMQNCCILR